MGKSVVSFQESNSTSSFDKSFESTDSNNSVVSYSVFKIYVDLGKSELFKFLENQTDENTKNYIMKQINDMKNNDLMYSSSRLMDKIYENEEPTKSFVLYHSNVNTCMDIIREFLDEIINNIQTMPLIIRYICKIISLLLLKKFPTLNIFELNVFIAQFLMLVFKPIFSDSEKKGILPSKYLSPTTKSNLVFIEKILLQAMSGSFFKMKDNYKYTPFNYYFIEYMPKLLTFFQTIINVKLPKLLTKLIDEQQTNPKIFEEFIYDHFKENPNEEINNISICFSPEQILTIIEIIQKNEKKLVSNNYKSRLPNEYTTYQKSYDMLKRSNKLSDLKEKIEKDKKDKTKSYSLIEYNLLNEKMEIISKLTTRHFILKEISGPKTKEETQKNIVIKVKNALSQILYNSYIIPQDDFFGYAINDTNDFINALNSFKQIDLYNFDNSIQTQWYIISLKSLIDKLPDEYKENDYSKLYNELTEDLIISIRQMEFDTITKAIDCSRYAKKKFNKTHQSLYDIEKLQSHSKVEDFIYKQQIEVYMKVVKVKKGKPILFVEPKENSLTERLDYLNCKVYNKDPNSLCKDINHFIRKFPNINESNIEKDFLEIEQELEIPTAVKNYLKILRNSVKAYGATAFTQLDYQHFQESENFIKGKKSTNIEKEIKEKYEERFYNQISNYIMERLYPKIYPSNAMENDLKIYQQCISLSWIELKHLTTITNINLETFLPSTIGYIEQMDKVKSPNEKIEQIVKVVQIISETIKFSYGDKVEGGLDDQLPLLTFVIIKSSPKRLDSNIRFIELFYEDLGTSLVNHKLVTMKAIGEKLCNFDHNSLRGVSETEFKK